MAPFKVVALWLALSVGYIPSGPEYFVVPRDKAEVVVKSVNFSSPGKAAAILHREKTHSEKTQK